MTTTYEGTATKTGAELYRFVLQEPQQKHIENFRDVLYKLDRLVWLVCLIENLSERGGHGQPVSPPFDQLDEVSEYYDDVQFPSTVKESAVYAERASAQVQVARIHYGSPMEVILALGAGSGVAVVFGHRVLRLFDRFQQSRLTKAGTDARVAAYRAIEQEITTTTRRARSVEEIQSALPSDQRQHISDAATALSALEQLEQLEPPA